MASIVTRKNKYSVVYSYTDESGAKSRNGKPMINFRMRKKEKPRLSISKTITLL